MGLSLRTPERATRHGPKKVETREAALRNALPFGSPVPTASYRIILCEWETGIVLDADGSRHHRTTGPHWEQRFESLDDALRSKDELLAKFPHAEVEILGPAGFEPLRFEPSREEKARFLASRPLPKRRFQWRFWRWRFR